MRAAALLVLLVPSLAVAQGVVPPGTSFITLGLGYAGASTNRVGATFHVGYHHAWSPRIAAGAQLQYHALDHSAADYAPCTPATCGTPRIPGSALLTLLVDVQAFVEPERVGPYLSLGLAPSYYLEPPDPGDRLLPGLTAAAGFDVPVGSGRIRLEFRYIGLIGAAVNRVDLGAATLGLTFPGCLTRACSGRALRRF